MNLFQLGKFTLSSGRQSSYKIDCDALTDEDWECLAYMASRRIPKFSHVDGVPTGGLKFAKALQKYATLPKESCVFMIADDVLTTGASMEKHADGLPECTVLGVCVFARGPCPHWVTALFPLPEEFAHE